MFTMRKITENYILKSKISNHLQNQNALIDINTEAMNRYKKGNFVFVKKVNQNQLLNRIIL